MEAAAVAVAAEQAVSTTAEVGMAYGVMKPTPTHSATYSRIPCSTSLPRIHHSIVVINEHAYIFGGEDDKGELVGDTVEIIKLSSLGVEKAGDHATLKAVSNAPDKAAPEKRKGHTAVAIEGKMFVFGGSGADGKPIEEKGRVWIFDPATTTWNHIEPSSGSEVPPSRTMHAAVGTDKPQPGSNLSVQDMLPSGPLSPVEQTSKVEETRYSGTLIIHGGDSLHDTWALDLYSQIWRPLPSPPANPTSSVPPTLALANSTLYTLHATSPFAQEIHSLPLKPQSGKLLPSQDAWTTTNIPTNPLTPGPSPRTGAPLLPITTGAGRLYLLYLMGERLPSPTPNPQAGSTTTTSAPDEATPKDESEQPTLLSDAHLYGVPAPLTTAAGIKDTIRSTLRLDTPVQGWEEVGVGADVPDAVEGEGKAHPGPRAWMAGDALDGNWNGEVGMEQGRGVVVWGGRNARGEVEGDGWVVRVGS